jgi:hypothetical protein
MEPRTAQGAEPTSLSVMHVCSRFYAPHFKITCFARNELVLWVLNDLPCLPPGLLAVSATLDHHHCQLSYLYASVPCGL